MNNIKYYILAYIKLIYLLLEKYTIFIYLLIKANFVNKTKNVNLFYDQIDDTIFSFEKHSWHPKSQIYEIYEMGHQKTLFKIIICMTNKYILIKLKIISDANKIEQKYNDCLKKIIFSERNVREEKSDLTMYDMVVKNINYYFKKKGAVVREKGFVGKRTYRFLYKVR